MLNLIKRCVSKMPNAGRDATSLAGEVVAPDDIRACQHEDVLVLLHIGKGTVYKSNRLGSRVWQCLEGGGNLAALIRELGEEYGVSPESVRRDVMEFIGELVQEGLLAQSK